MAILPKPRRDSEGKTFYTFSDALSLPPKVYEEWALNPQTTKVHYVSTSETGGAHEAYWGKSSLYTPFLFWPVFVSWLLYFTSPNVPHVQAFYLRGPYFLTGMILWFPLEALFHKHLFHLTVRGPITQKIHLYLHGIHHLAPLDLGHIVAPIYELGVQAVFVSAVLWLIGVRDVAAVVAGLLLQYLRYDAVHWVVHAWSAAQCASVPLLGAYLERCHRQHKHHHWVDSSVNFAISYPSHWIPVSP